MAGTNIYQNIIQAMIQIIAIDDLQLSEGSGGQGTFKYEDWKWIAAESAYWTSIRNILEPLLDEYNNKRTITSEQRDEVKLAIKDLRIYSGTGLQGHRLFLKIAAFGDNHDWEIGNIKLGTPLAKKPGKAKGDLPAMLQPMLNVIRNILGEQLLSVRNPETPDSRRLPPGMKFAKVYRFIGPEPSKKVTDYVFVGNAKRGRLAVNFFGIEISGTTRLYAYYIARYESNKGELGEPCTMISAEILF